MIEYKNNTTILRGFDKPCLEFNRWLNSAKPRDIFIYYDGEFLPVALHKHVYPIACTGEVYLVQRKYGVGKYQFLAIKSEYKIAKLIPHGETKKFKIFVRNAA